MADDPYSVLGIARSASDDEVRRAFLKLAKELHPDVRPGDKAAAERFKRVNAANDILGDPEKRRKYDRGEIDASGEPRRAYHGFGAGAPFGARGARAGAGAGDDTGFGGIFEDLFGGGAGRFGRGRGGGFPARGQDVRYTLDIDFLESITGTTKRVTMPEGGMLDLAVPEGVADKQVLRLKGKGQSGPRGGEAGDALVEIRVRPHPDFARDGDDISYTLALSLDEAILGGKVEVPTATGRVQLTIPKGTSSGRVFRLKGKGVKNLTTGATGDQLVKIAIVLPATIDDKLAYFISEWRQDHGYDPRKKR